MPAVPLIEDDDPYSQRLRRQYGLESFQPSPAQVRLARHGYYGAVSYADDLVGGVLQALTESGMAKNTVVVFTTDHGDMLGERGLWYKRSFFEGSSRIPLIISWPERFAPARVSANVSLVDLLPTFLDLATSGDGRVEPVDPLAGRSLVPVLDGARAPATDDVVFGENLSEGATAPILMAKRGEWKYVWSGCDPAQLFNLVDDPLELSNLAGAAEHADLQAELDDLLHRRWDVEELTHRVLESQRRRAFLRSLHANGGAPDWRHVPADQATVHVLPEGVRYNDWVYDNVL